MRAITAYILLLAIILPTLSPWGTIAYFQLNREYIAKVLCENRARPQLKCNGKCYLARKLKQQQQKQDKETSDRVENMPVVQLYIYKAPSFIFEACVFELPLKTCFFFRLAHYAAALPALYEPPRQ